MSTNRIARASATTFFAAAVVAAGLLSACRGNSAATEQTAQATPPPALNETSPDDRLTVDVRAAELAEREAEVARREAELARRETRQPRQPIASPPRVAVKPPVPAPPQPPVYQEPGPREPVREEPVRRTVTVASGTGIAAELETNLSSATSALGDNVTARVAENVYAGGAIAIPAGSRIYGTVSEAHGLRKVGGQARLAVDFTRLELPSGESVPFAAGYAMLTRSETPKDAATIGGAAAAGAVLGHNVYKRDRDKGRVLGAILGGAIGTVVATKTRGGEIEVPAGTVLDLTLDGAVSVQSSA